MFAKEYKQERLIVIYDDKNRTAYHVHNANDEEMDSCWTWTDNDCKSYLKNNTGNCVVRPY